MTIFSQKRTNFILFVVSWVIVAFGQPTFSSFLSILASAFGYSLFWMGMCSFPLKKSRFLCSTIWFTSVQAVQLSWLATPEYQGIYIYFVYAILICLLGLQFGLLSLMIPSTLPINLFHIFGIASFWTLLEWSRLYFFCGFAWNPVGLSLSAYPISSGLASIGGVFGLSFCVISINLFALNALFFLKGFFQGVNNFLPKRPIIISGIVLLIPYLFGFLQIRYHEQRKNSIEKEIYQVALIQTALKPDQKGFFNDQTNHVSPFDQWKRIIQSIKISDPKSLDLIVLPEAALPYKAHQFIYPYEEVLKIIQNEWGPQDFSHLLYFPLAQQKEGFQGGKWIVSNAFWGQALADHYASEVIVGLDDTDHLKKESYNAAFYFSPNNRSIQRYEKRILLPLVEYLPYSFLYPLTAEFGITDFFTPGTEAKVFKTKHPLSISICYEDCFSNIVREGRLKGAKLLVNITNDGWFPHSRLPLQHFDHGKLRAIENGVPLVRSCNTGVTSGIDSLGRVIGKLQDDKGHFEWMQGALILPIDLYSYPTLYTRVGDTLILGLSSLFLFIFWIQYFLNSVKSHRHKSNALAENK